MPNEDWGKWFSVSKTLVSLLLQRHGGVSTGDRQAHCVPALSHFTNEASEVGFGLISACTKHYLFIFSPVSPLFPCSCSVLSPLTPRSLSWVLCPSHPHHVRLLQLRHGATQCQWLSPGQTAATEALSSKRPLGIALFSFVFGSLNLSVQAMGCDSRQPLDELPVNHQ